MPNYHTICTNQLRKVLKASFVGYVTVNDSLSLRIVKDGREEFIDFKTKDLNNITPQVYENILTDLIEVFGHE